MSLVKYEVVTKEHFPPFADEPGEALTGTQKMIVHLRDIREARKLSVPDVEEMLNRKISRTTLNRFFSKDSETRYNFNFEFTVLPIWRALVVEDTVEIGDAVAKAKVSGIESLLQIREEQIEALKQELEAQRAAFEHRCEDYDSRLKLWHEQIRQKDEQIQKKDERMDRKDGIIADQSKEIHELRARIDELIAHHDQEVHELRALIDDLSAKLTENAE